MSLKDLHSNDLLFAQRYFEEFGESQRPMAADQKSLTFCGEIIRSQNVCSILDAGSGLSSFYFHARFKDVETVDDSPYWAEKTQSFIRRTLDKKIEISELTTVKEKKFDFVFYDYGNIETRIYYFLPALGMCRRFFYIDDVHVSYYRDYIHEKCKKYHLRFLPETLDRYGRYGALITI